MQLCIFTDFKRSQWLITDVNSVLEFFRRVLVSDFADVSEVHAASIFRALTRLYTYVTCVLHASGLLLSDSCKELFDQVTWV
jgi:hypothetical protein